MSSLTQSGGAKASSGVGGNVTGSGDRPIHAPGWRIDRWSLAAWIVAALASIPVLAVVVSAPGDGYEAIAHLARTVLGRYIANTMLLMLIAGAIAVSVGTGCAWLVSATAFPGRKLFRWALILPLALPAYIAAYIYAGLLDFSGPVQSLLRAATGWELGDYAFPQIRSLWGGGFVLGIVLYPYVYLLARSAFETQSLRQFSAARSLGANPWTAFWKVALPAARPAIAGGVLLVLMETLADFGVAEYFAIPTFSTGIFRSWLAMGDKQAALKLSAIMLLFVIALIFLEARTRKGRTSSRDGHGPRKNSHALLQLSLSGKVLAFIACALPLLLGFGIPATYLASLALTDTAIAAIEDIGAYIGGSLWLGLATAIVCVSAALLLAFARTRSTSRVTSAAIRVSTLGYALPGALLAVGLLAPIGTVDLILSRFARDSLGYTGGLILAGTSAVLIYALSVRFLTVAFNSIDGGLSKIPPSLDAAARSLGAGPAKVLSHIYIPLLGPSLSAAVALVLIDTMRELPATLILRPFNLETLATRTYRLASDERLIEASIPALLLLLVGILPVLLLNGRNKA